MATRTQSSIIRRRISRALSQLRDAEDYIGEGMTDMAKLRAEQKLTTAAAECKRAIKELHQSSRSKRGGSSEKARLNRALRGK